MRLFCFPFAGGGAWTFGPWKRALEPHATVLPVDYPGRGLAHAQTPPASLNALVDQLLARLTPELQPPYALFGHSMGAWVAFELARTVIQAGLPGPARLIVSAARPPNIPRSPPTGEVTDEALFAQLDSLRGPGLKIEHPELRAMTLALFRMDLRLLQSHRFIEAPRLSCPLLALGGAEDRTVSAADLEAWGALTSGPLTTRTLPGGHLYLLSHPAPLLELLTSELQAV